MKKTNVVAMLVLCSFVLTACTSKKSEKEETYISYCTAYKTCVNRNSSNIAASCGKEVQLKYPELYVENGYSEEKYIDYCLDYKTCVNRNNPSIAASCGEETQLKYPELFIRK